MTNYANDIIAQPAKDQAGVFIENRKNLETGVVHHRIALPGLKNPFASAKVRWQDLSLYVSDLDKAVESVSQLQKLLLALQANDGVVTIGDKTLDVRYQKAVAEPTGAVGQDALNELFGDL